MSQGVGGDLIVAVHVEDRNAEAEEEEEEVPDPEYLDEG